MPQWRDINRDAWMFSTRAIVGAGGGVGEFQSAYAILEDGKPLLNGQISAEVKMADWSRTGAGLVCRADDLWTLVAFFVAPSESPSRLDSTDNIITVSTTARVGVFKFGVFHIIGVLKENVILNNDWNVFTLSFIGGRVRGEIQTTYRKYVLEVLCPHIPFPGYCGVIKFFQAEVTIKNVKLENVKMLVDSRKSRNRSDFEFDVFICHSTADKPLVMQVVSELKLQGIRYWLDEEQIRYGDSITQRIEAGISRSRYLVPFLSKNLSSSGWTKVEYGAILNSEFSGDSERVVVPLRLDNCEDKDVPLLLRDKKRVKFEDKADFSAFVKFLGSG